MDVIVRENTKHKYSISLSHAVFITILFTAQTSITRLLQWYYTHHRGTQHRSQCCVWCVNVHVDDGQRSLGDTHTPLICLHFCSMFLLYTSQIPFSFCNGERKLHSVLEMNMRLMMKYSISLSLFSRFEHFTTHHWQYWFGFSTCWDKKLKWSVLNQKPFEESAS